MPVLFGAVAPTETPYGEPELVESPSRQCARSSAVTHHRSGETSSGFTDTL